MLPLENIRVISIEQAVAAPLASRHLADFGATVIKIERPATGDFARGYDQAVHGLSSWFVWLNRSKQSLTLDLKHPAARPVLEKLLAGSDVLLHNLAPGATGRLGLAASELRERHPGLIVCQISGYGDRGPYGNKKAYDLLIQNETGVVSLTGTPETPCKAGISAADIAAGMYAFSGILLALRRREQTGRGGQVSVSLFDSLGEWVMPAAYYAAYSGSIPAREGAEHAFIAPYGPFACGDGKAVILAIQNQREWRRFCSHVLAKPGLARDPRFCSNSLRSQNRAALRRIIEQVFGRFAAAEIVRQLESAGIAHADSNDVRQFWNHPQHAARNRWRHVPTEAGDIQALAPPVILDGLEPNMGAVPALGQHTAEILAGLGLAPQAIDRLRQAGAI